MENRDSRDAYRRKKQLFRTRKVLIGAAAATVVFLFALGFWTLRKPRPSQLQRLVETAKQIDLAVKSEPISKVGEEQQPAANANTDTPPTYTYTNHLSGETSPYLLMHAHNPVDWYPWRDDAFKKARSENKPIFLSVGYAACHWCGVMERESFSDPAIAEIMNRHFVSIKLDREERPDIDRVYLTFLQLTTGICQASELF
jgi:Protein of unknown function, DUF255